jgi:hypothetical protein
MAGIGLTVASEVIAATLLGWLFDRWRGFGNTGVIVGATAGIAVGMWTLIKSTLRLNQQLERTAPTAGRGRPLPTADPNIEDEDDDDDDWNQSNEWRQAGR